MTIKHLLCTLTLLSFSFTNVQAQQNKNAIINIDIDSLLASYKVKGTVLIFDSKAKQYITNDSARANTGFIPASTFKIPNTLIALENNIITTDSVFVWDKKPKALPVWEKDMNIKQAYDNSSVPIYQGIARSIGVDRMRYYTRLFHFGEMDIHQDNLDTFWLEGKSTITPFQQLYFLMQLQNESLPLKKETMQTVKKIMVMQEGENYTLRAKTGWGEKDEKPIGWHVGYLTTDDNIYFFATNIEPLTDDLSSFANDRIQITKVVLKNLSNITL